MQRNQKFNFQLRLDLLQGLMFSATYTKETEFIYLKTKNNRILFLVSAPSNILNGGNFIRVEFLKISSQPSLREVTWKFPIRSFIQCCINMLWTWKKLFRQEMERQDWKAYPNCLKPCPLTHSKSWPFKWGHVYKMVASIDISSPGKWFSIYKITDAIVWRLKMTVVTVLLNKEKGKPGFNKNYHPYKRPPCMYLGVSI